jgi:rod shape-determining protein MreC
MKLFRNKLAVVIILLSVTFLILIGYTSSRENKSAVENGVGVTLNVVQGALYSITDRMSGFVSFVVNFSAVKEENEYLRARNRYLESRGLDYDVIKKQNERMRDKLGFVDRNTQYEFIACNIVARSGGGIIDNYTVDKGTKDGVLKGMIVVTADGLVGQVTDTANSYSIVQTIASENIAVSAMVKNTEENNGIVKGYREFNRKLLAKIYHLPLDSNIKEGDVILTRGQGFLYPKGIRIGYVIEVEEDRGKIQKNAVIQPYVDFNRTEEVLIVVPTDKEAMRYLGEEIR